MKEEYLWIIKEEVKYLKRQRSSMARKKLVKNERKQKFECFFFTFMMGFLFTIPSAVLLTKAPKISSYPINQREEIKLYEFLRH